MNTYLVIAVILVLVLGYFYFMETHRKTKVKRKISRKPKVAALKNRYIYIRQALPKNVLGEESEQREWEMHGGLAGESEQRERGEDDYHEPKQPKGKFVAINKLTRFLYLVDSVNRAEIFTLDKFPEAAGAEPPKPKKNSKNEETNKIYIKSMDNFYVNLKYAISHKNEYDVVAGNEYLSNLSKLRLLRDSIGYYIEFFNGYYLCVSNGLLYCAKDVAKIFYFNFVVKNNHGKAKVID